MKKVCVAALTLSALLGAGCLTESIHQAYAGAPLPAHETCTLRVPAMLDVRGVDGVPMDWSLRVKQGSVQELSLLPGNHQLWVRYYDPTADATKQEIYEADRILVSFNANPESVSELKYETWTHNPELRKAKEKVHVWVVQLAPGVAAAPQAGKRAAVVAPPTSATAGTSAAGNTKLDGAKTDYNSLAPAERETFLKWLLAQP